MDYDFKDQPLRKSAQREDRLPWLSHRSPHGTSENAANSRKNVPHSSTTIDRVWLSLHREQVIEAFTRHRQIAKVARMFRVSRATIEQALVEQLQGRRSA